MYKSIIRIGIHLVALSVFGQAAQLIHDVRVFDGYHVLEHRSVLIEGEKISQIGDVTLKAEGAKEIDGRGSTLLPGLIDAHVHLPDHMEDALRQALYLGVTTELDMFNAGDRLPRIKKIEAEDAPDLAGIRTAGIGATVPGGHPSQMGGPPIPTITSPEQADAFVQARISEGSDYIKIIHDNGETWYWTNKRVPMLDNATMRALIKAAHARGKLVVVHALSESQARDAISAGADGIAHMFTGDSVTPDFGKFAARHHVFVVTTLSTLYLDCGKSEGPSLLKDPDLAPYIYEEWKERLAMPKPDPQSNHWCRATEEGLRQLLQEHVPILAGTDAPIPGTAYGASLHGELSILVNSGLTPLQALQSATSLPAKYFRLTDRGEIRPGMRADLVLVAGDPTTDIRATRKIISVWKRGVLVPRRALSQNAAQPSTIDPNAGQ
jgi:imidazolonepropionase-like amidohydrolase